MGERNQPAAILTGCSHAWYARTRKNRVGEDPPTWTPYGRGFVGVEDSLGGAQTAGGGLVDTSTKSPLMSTPGPMFIDHLGGRITSILG